MRRRHTYCLTLALLAAIAGLAAPGREALAETAVRSAPQAQPIAARDAAKARGTRLKQVKFSAAIVKGNVGEIRTGANCAVQKPIYLDAKLSAELGEAIAFSVGKNLRELGYLGGGAEQSVFADTPAKPIELELGTMVQEIEMKACQGANGEVEGSFFWRGRWEIYSPQARKVVYSVSADGSANGKFPAWTELYRAAAGSLVRNFLADADAAAWLGGAKPLPEALPKPDGPRLEPVSPPPGGVSRNATLLRAAVVTIETGQRTGSGFVISRRSDVLTNEHVVGEQRFVKIRLASGREVVGEVVQRDSTRDVALIKTEAGLDPLALRTADVTVGETVYALGSPLGEKFSGSLTRGVVSAYRNRGGQRFIQSDVAILSGSSGGPLIDEEGRVVAITQSGIEAGRAKINLFVPIAEALDSLGIKLEK